MNNPDKQAALPRLLYLGDVPVESSYHGSALLYRLLETYPADRLQVVEAGWHDSLPERRLKAVPYYFQSLSLFRLFHSRFTRWVISFNLLMADRRARQFQDLVEAFKPQAVLTVAHGISWITAASLAQKLKIPLHLICHDEWVDIFPALPVIRQWKEQIFRKIYQMATSRLCVSPSMVEDFAKRYGADGKLLYPSRAVNATTANVPAERLKRLRNGLVVAYAGSVYSPESLRLLAECLEPLGGKLLIFAPGSRGQGAFANLELPNIHFQGLLDSRELIARLREEADLLFVPMSFLPKDRANIETCFPSKLTDYTAVGLPILIHGPEYGSAIRWARENPGAAEVLTSWNAAELIETLQRLKASPEVLISLAEGAIEAGQQFFSHEKAWDIFQEVLLSPDRDAESGTPVSASLAAIK